MREINKIAEGLFEKVRDRFADVSLGDENAMAVQDPEKARFFNFDYIVDGENHGNITISLIDETSLKVYFSKNISHDLDQDQKKQWYGFLRELREFAKRNLLSFEPRDITRSTLKHRDIKQVSKSDNTYDKDDVIGESRMYGTSRSSYENDGPVRIVIRHTGNINTEQRGARSRKIKAIYLENSDGERLKLPENNLRYARAMARHCSEGGSIYDAFGQHITEIAEECNKLKPFRTAMIRRVFEDEETQHMVEAAFEYHGLLKNTLGKMSGRKGYQQCREQFEATSTSYIPEEDIDVESLKERFVKRTYNDRMADALPIVQKAYNMKKTNKFAQQFESWAENTANWDEAAINVDDLAELFAEELPLGVDAIDAQTAVSGIINSNDLEEQLLHAAQANPTADARDIIAAWLEENQPEVFQELMGEMDNTEQSNEYGADGAVYEGEFNDDGSYNTSDDELVKDEEDRFDHEQGPDTFDAVVSAITRRIINQHTDLLKAHGPEAVLDAIKDVASFNDDVEEIGSSDVSGWCRQVARQLGSDLDEAFVPREDKPILRKSASPSKKTQSKKYYDYLAKSLGEAYSNGEEQISQWGIPHNEWSEFEQAAEQAISAIDSEEKYHMVSGMLDQIDKPVADAIDNGLGKQDSQELVIRVLNALQAGQQQYGTEPRAALDLATTVLHRMARAVGQRGMNEGRVKELDADIRELSDKEFLVKYKKTKKEMKAALDEGIGDDYANKDVKMKRMGAKPLNTLDKLKMMPRQAKAMARGDSEDDLVNYNKQFNEELVQMLKIAGL